MEKPRKSLYMVQRGARGLLAAVPLRGGRTAFLTHFPRGLFLAFLLLCPPAAAAEDAGSVTESRVKAAYLYRFCEYVEWPETAFSGPASPLVIGILGNGRIVADLERTVAGRRVEGRSIEVRRLRTGDSIEGVHVLFIPRSQSRDLAAVLAEARTQSTLTITEWQDAGPAGGIINFIVIDDRVRFDIALEPARRSNLRISSRLLNVARNVINGTS